ncbi:hypothetical protein Celaphus_00015675, partial [Cervus elaphus hippelaphus]
IAADEPPPEGCNSFFSVHGKKTCDFDTLETLLLTASERPKPLLFKGDHRYPSSNPESSAVIFYSEIGSEEFYNFHRQLVSKSNAGKINYVFRHYVSNPRKEPVYLSGYGVELAIKSTEYKAKDDTQVKVNTTVIGESDPIDEVQGFLFGKLRDLHPDLKGQLKELRKHLVESTNEMAPLKVWQLQDLSFQAAARILAAPVELALVIMKDLSQNFPTKASLFDILRNEARVMEGLHRLGIEGLSLHNVLKLNIQPSEADYAVDIRSPAISMYNKVRTGERLKVEHVVTVLEKKYPYVEVNSILGIDSAYDQNRK